MNTNMIHGTTNPSSSLCIYKCKLTKMWTRDLQDVLVEALQLYPARDSKLRSNGRLLGRYQLIAKHILDKTSKVFTLVQIYARLQALKTENAGNTQFMQLLDGTGEPFSEKDFEKQAQINSEGSAKSDVHHAMWPSYMCFYLELPLQQISHAPVTQVLCVSPAFPAKIYNVKRDLHSKYPYFSCNNNITTIVAKVSMNLDPNLVNFAFKNMSTFETEEHYAIECTTYIYSYNNQVLESTEVKTAQDKRDGRFVYCFTLANTFFDVLLKELHGEAYEKKNELFHHIAIVQVFKNSDNEQELLNMIYEFQLGDGSLTLENVQH